MVDLSFEDKGKNTVEEEVGHYTSQQGEAT